MPPKTNARLLLFSGLILATAYEPPVAAAQYCSAGGTAGYEWISRVELNGGVQTSGDDGAYIDRTGSSLTTLAVDETYTLIVHVVGSEAPCKGTAEAWIDFNLDGQFSQSNEELGLDWNDVSYDCSETQVLMTTFTVPNFGVPTVQTRLRVMMNYTGTGASPTPCETTRGGEVEDYAVTITSETDPCNGRGDWSPGTGCTCYDGWSDINCTVPICDPSCVNGACVAPDTCSCATGWDGDVCDVPVCAAGCVNGSCTAPDTCICTSGWSGDACDMAICDPACVNGTCSAPDACTCESGWDGPTCEIAVDAGVMADAGIATDAGVTADAGLSLDAGLVTDAGVALDTGVMDAGSGGMADTGAPDEGPSTLDQAQPVPDTGPSRADAGSAPRGGGGCAVATTRPDEELDLLPLAMLLLLGHAVRRRRTPGAGS